MLKTGPNRNYFSKEVDYGLVSGKTRVSLGKEPGRKGIFESGSDGSDLIGSTSNRDRWAQIGRFGSGNAAGTGVPQRRAARARRSSPILVLQRSNRPGLGSGMLITPCVIDLGPQRGLAGLRAVGSTAAAALSGKARRRARVRASLCLELGANKSWRAWGRVVLQRVRHGGAKACTAAEHRRMVSWSLEWPTG